MFRYIALELCSASLQEYVEKEAVRERCVLKPMEILFQATEGVAYLHSIKIGASYVLLKVTFTLFSKGILIKTIQFITT